MLVRGAVRPGDQCRPSLHPLIFAMWVRSAGTHMSEMQQQVLRSALVRAQKEVQAEVGATWCDALPCLLAMEWPRARQHLLTPQPQSTSVVVQAWMQVGMLPYGEDGCLALCSLQPAATFSSNDLRVRGHLPGAAVGHIARAEHWVYSTSCRRTMSLHGSPRL